ncbi:MAG: hypothetical protein E6Q94_10875 [Burkholderiaceae bacterium]|nr:MAG: hypothetical protein E6Q94_10875 [Burkholderiaceae bacterium]
MAGFIALLAVFMLAVIVALVFIVTKLEQRKAEHQREMQDLVRGRTGRTATLLESTPDSPEFGGVAQAFTTAAISPQPQQSDLIRELEAIRRLGQKGRAKQAQEDAVVRRAERMHQQLLAEVARDNREPRSRPPGPCTLQINYVDAEGEWTSRRIAPYKSGNTNEKFDAWCETRQARRTFFFSRVQNGVHISTGTRLDRAGVFRHIHPGRRVPHDLR